MIVCTPKTLHPFYWKEAAATACRHNPANAPALAGLGVLPPEHIALVTSRYWGSAGAHLTVQALEDCPAALWGKIIDHANAWGQYGNVSFDTVQSGGQVRIAFQPDGYWSYIGTDILSISDNQQTMNLAGFNSTFNPPPESEYHRVVRHEAGHSLGFPHEHSRKDVIALLDPPKVYAYFEQTQGWSKDMIDAQILTPLDEASLMGTPVDVTSIMTYQFPGSITKSGQPIPGGLDIDPNDGLFCGKVYPRNLQPGPQPVAGVTQEQLKAIVDGVLDYLAKQSRWPWIANVVAGAKNMADSEMPALWAFLHDHGIL